MKAKVDGLTALSLGKGEPARIVGAGLSPNDIVASDGGLLNLDELDQVLTVDARLGRVRVQAGARLADITRVVDDHGLAFPMLGSISHQTIGGAVATATHGTGLRCGVLSTLVEAVRLITPAGDTIEASATHNPEVFAAARCSLGSLGAVTELTLRLEPAFDLEAAERSGELEAVLERLDENLASDHYRFWYLPHADRVWEWRADRRPPDPSCRTAAPSAAKVIMDRLVGFHAYEAALYAASFAPTLLPSINRWYAGRFLSGSRLTRDRSDRLFNFDCLFRQHVDEWAIPVEHTAQAVRSLRQLIVKHDLAVHMPIEVRFVKGDDIWLSPAYGRDSCYIGVIAYRPYGRDTDHAAYFAAFDDLMSGFDGRPHWAKSFTQGAEWLATRYPRWADFQAVRARCDPRGRLTNAYTDRVLGPVVVPPEAPMEERS